MPKYYLGVDGGGTNCRIRLADENLNTLAEAGGGPSNLQLQGGEPAYRSVRDGIEQVFAELGGDIAAAKAATSGCFCMAGGRLPSDREEFQHRDWPLANVRVYDDIDAAHAGALGGEEGAVIIAGTGSAALAIVDGERHQCGGWGFHIGDQMSAAILGRELIRLSVEAADGLVEGSPLTEAVIAALGGDLDTVMAWSFPEYFVDGGEGTVAVPEVRIGDTSYKGFTVTRAPTEWGRFTRMLFDYFEQDDPVAIKLVDLELDYVDSYVRWFKARGAQRMAATGGLGERLYPMLKQRYGEFIVRPQGDNLSGAVILARQNFA